jgi:predicted TIM-barrel fold metal-dependent hydrolase
MQLKYGFISADDHVVEHADVWTSRISRQKWGDRIPHVERQSDGSDCWVIAGERVALPEVAASDTGSAVAVGARDALPLQPRQWEEIPRAAYGATERLTAMDQGGVDYSVLYPAIAGLAGQRFGRLNDTELELACVRAYNDWLIEEWASVSSRFVPQCIAPIWPVENTVAEIRRAVAKGHKGVVFPASPMELRELPHINEPVYDPLWAACADLEVPLCFHSGGSSKIQLRAGETFSAGTVAAFQDIVRSVSSIAVLANFLFSRVLYRYPKLKVVFAESSLGWGAYEIEYADYQSDADGLQSEGYPLKPSELFQRQCYFTCWYDRMSLKVRRYLGASNILWSTHFPLASTTGPNSRQQVETNFAEVPEEEKRKILWENAAKLYRL